MHDWVPPLRSRHVEVLFWPEQNYVTRQGSRSSMPAVGVKEAEAGSVAKLNRPIFTELGMLWRHGASAQHDILCYRQLNSVLPVLCQAINPLSCFQAPQDE